MTGTDWWRDIYRKRVDRGDLPAVLGALGFHVRHDGKLDPNPLNAEQRTTSLHVYGNHAYDFGTGDSFDPVTFIMAAKEIDRCAAADLYADVAGIDRMDGKRGKRNGVHPVHPPKAQPARVRRELDTSWLTPLTDAAAEALEASDSPEAQRARDLLSEWRITPEVRRHLRLGVFAASVRVPGRAYATAGRERRMWWPYLDGDRAIYGSARAMYGEAPKTLVHATGIVGSRPSPYNAAAFDHAPAAGYLLMLEGEKDTAAALVALGTNAPALGLMGGVMPAGAWHDRVAALGVPAIVCFDADEAGRTKAAKLIAKLRAAGCATVHDVVVPAPHKDAADVLAAEGADHLRHVLLTWPAEGEAPQFDTSAPGPGHVDAPAETGDAPEAGNPLQEPAGWRRKGSGTIERVTSVDRDGEPKWGTVYVGHLAVVATGRTLEGEERLSVAFDVGHERRTITAPRGELVRARGVLDHLGAGGANVHDGNARNVARYLSEFASLNAEALPRLTLSERLGITPGGIIGPGWQVGEHITYAGPELHSLRILSDRGAYLDGLRALASWEPTTWLPRAVLGLVAAAPHLEHLGLVRNPVLGIGAPSNIGKNTAVAFAFGLYATAGHPLMVSGIRTRTTALLQVFAQANGLPIWIDEAHMLDEHTLVDGVYAFANRQTYARGGREGTARGGDPLRGVLILTGEGLAELTATGARNRVLIVDGTQHYPLGMKEAPERVTTLQQAYALGAGSVGRAVTAHLWEHRGTWTRDVRQAAERISSDAPLWHLAAAAAAVTIRYIYDALDLPADPGAERLAQHMVAAIGEGWREVDPTREAFERVRDLVIAARATDGTRRARDGGALARVVGTEDGTAAWAVRATAPDVEEVLKRYGGARVVAPLWKQRGYVRPDAQGKATRPAKLETGEPAVRCYLFPIDLFDADRDGEPSAEARRVGLGERPVN